MDQGLIPRRYAKALYKIGDGRAENKLLYELMQALVAAFDAEATLKQAISNPFVSNKDKMELLTAAVGLKTTESGSTFVDFVKLLLQNRRVDMFKEIAYAFIDLYREENNIFRVEIISAAPLRQEELERLKNVIAKYLQKGTLEYVINVDSDLIGGFVVNVNSERLDASVKNELKQLRLNLIN